MILVVVYLTRGRYRRFPGAFTARAGTLRNHFRFHTIRLWEHAERIRSGDLPELAPLLVLCEDTPTESTLREERALILGLETTRETRAELLAVALTVGLRYFQRELLETLFQEELEMLKGASIIQDWIEQGIAEGEARRARSMLLRLLLERFGEVPGEVIQGVESRDPDWCEEMAARAVRAHSLKELDLLS